MYTEDTHIQRETIGGKTLQPGVAYLQPNYVGCHLGNKTDHGHQASTLVYTPT